MAGSLPCTWVSGPAVIPMTLLGRAFSLCGGGREPNRVLSMKLAAARFLYLGWQHQILADVFPAMLPLLPVQSRLQRAALPSFCSVRHAARHSGGSADISSNHSPEFNVLSQIAAAYS